MCQSLFPPIYNYTFPATIIHHSQSSIITFGMTMIVHQCVHLFLPIINNILLRTSGIYNYASAASSIIMHHHFTIINSSIIIHYTAASTNLSHQQLYIVQQHLKIVHQSTINYSLFSLINNYILYSTNCASAYPSTINYHYCLIQSVHSNHFPCHF